MKTIMIRGFASLVLAWGVAVASAGDASGVWKWTLEVPNGEPIPIWAQLSQTGDKLTGTYKSIGEPSPIKDGKVTGDKVGFAVDREIQGNKFTLNYDGKMAGTNLTGNIKFKFDDNEQSWEWKAERLTTIANATGTWEWSYTPGNGEPVQLRLKLKQVGPDVTGSVAWADDETAISKAKLAGEQLTFEVNAERNGQTYNIKFAGKIKDDTLTGTTTRVVDGEDRTREWVAKRAAAK